MVVVSPDVPEQATASTTITEKTTARRPGFTIDRIVFACLSLAWHVVTAIHTRRNLRENAWESNLIWKGLGVLLGSAGLVVVGVVAVARLTVPDEPDFSEGFEQAADGADGSLNFVPTAIGAELQVSGAREGTITLENNIGGPGYGLGDARTQIFFESSPLSITQMSHDGLAFFPDPDDCEFTAGEHNEEIGLAAARVVCSELVDIRDNGTISIEGHVALPSDVVVDRDLPELGGTVTVGDETWEMAEANLGIHPESHVDEPVILDMWTGNYDRGMTFEMDRETETLTLAQVYWPEGESDVPVGACSIGTEHLVQVEPNHSIHQLDLACDTVAVRGMGEVPITGSIVFSKFYFEDPQG